MYRHYIIYLLFNTVGVLGLKVWGPGLHPSKNILPVQYFFIQLGEEEYHENAKDNSLEVFVEGRFNSRPCQSRTEIFKRNYDFFIVRFKLYHECSDIKIRILLDGIPLLEPMTAAGTGTPDHCNCPRGDLADWITENKCSISSTQMEEDLGRFKDGVKFSQGLDKARNVFKHPGSHAWCHYVSKSGELYRRCYGEHVGFSMFWDSLLGWLGRRTRLPDMEFMANLGDWPLVKEKYSGIPMFSWCGSRDTEDIIVPTYELTESVLECMGRQGLDLLSAMGKNEISWAEKAPRMFWRGRDSRRERLDLVQMAAKNPDLINASITNFFFFRDEMEKYGGRTQAVSFFDFFNYKYQLNIDGTVAAYRFPFLLSGSSLVFKQESQYFEHFYADLKAWVHYVPLKADLSDVLEKIKWAQENDEKAQEIVNNAQIFVLENLLPQHVLCYHAQLLDRWAGLLTEEVQIHPDMTQVPLEKEGTRWPACSCRQEQPDKKQEL